MKCDFCNRDSNGTTTFNSRWSFRTCGSWDCKRRLHIILKILVGDLSNKTILTIARTIPEKELYAQQNDHLQNAWKSKITLCDNYKLKDGKSTLLGR